ncbi:MAG: response regulator [Phycisphaerae bacterium]
MGDSEDILLIDDDPDMHTAVRLMLEPMGYRVRCCLTGPAGLAAAHEIRPALLLLDVMLSSPSEGFHVAYDFRSDEQLAHVPIVMISAIGDATGIDFAREAGSAYLPVERFLSKPIDAATLRRTVDDVLHGAAARAMP